MDLGFTLAKDEKVIQKVNRHWITLAPVVVPALMAVVVAIGITYIFGRYRSSFPSTMTGAGLVVFDLIMVVFAIGLLYAGYWVYRRNFLVLTNQHLVRVEQRGLFAHSVSQLSLSRLQDVSGSVRGFTATILGFGNLTVETAGSEDNFVFYNIYAPAEVAAICLKAHEAYKPITQADEADDEADGTEEAQAKPPAEPMPTIPPAAVEPSAPVEPAPVVQPIDVAEFLPPTPTEAPAPSHGPVPLDESVTAEIEHHDQV
jgi:uncharacterized membrane protein YdbT with pleckstrin-like domain